MSLILLLHTGQYWNDKYKLIIILLIITFNTHRVRFYIQMLHPTTYQFIFHAIIVFKASLFNFLSVPVEPFHY